MTAADLLKRALAHPLTRGISIDDPRATDLRRQIVKDKVFLRRIYQEWYEMIGASLPAGPGRVLELGSGAGFMKEFVPEVITSEIFACPGIDVVLDAQQMPLPDSCLRGIVMTDVLHHLPDVRRFFREATRTVRSGGVISVIEPWVTRWSKMIYTKLHHEPFEPGAKTWEFPTTGPLSGANGALPWIVFVRDCERFEREFPGWRIEKIAPFMPARYLISGGVSMRSLMPGWSFGLWRGIEKALAAYNDKLAMFAHVVLRRI